MAEAWVYVLRCGDGSLYTGWTVDVQRRLASHRAGTASRYTASRLPVELAWVQRMPDRGAARRKEARIKKLARPQKLALLAAGSRRAALQCPEPPDLAEDSPNRGLPGARGSLSR